MNHNGLEKMIDVVCIMIFVLLHLVMAKQIQEPEDITEVKYIVEFSEAELSFNKLEGYDLIYMKNASASVDLGKPVLPEINLRIAIPAGTEVIAVEAKSMNSLEIPGSFYVMPGQPALKTSESGFQLSVEPDDAVYGSGLFYPDKLTRFVLQSDLAGQEIAEVIVYPVQYVPKDRRLILHKSMELIVKCRPSKTHNKEFVEHYYRFTEKQRQLYEEMLKTMVVNPQDVVVNPPLGEISRVLPSGSFDHVIITSNSLSSDLQPLVDWHTKKGMRDTVVTTGWIYANYPGSINARKIRNFVIDAAGTWGTMYFLMGGEHSAVPFYYRTYYKENTPSDQYYSDYDDDWTHEVFVGRVSVENSTEVTRVVNKILKYERDPPRDDPLLDNYVSRVLLIGMNLDNSTPMEYLKEAIDDLIPGQHQFPPRFDVTKVYDSQGGDHQEAVIEALNKGQHLVNHIDHSDWDYMGTGHEFHGLGITNSDVDNLHNFYETSIVVSIGCRPNEMDYIEDCIAEHFVIHNRLGAGIAFTGNTRAGWYYVGEIFGLSSTLDYEWWRALMRHRGTIHGGYPVDGRQDFRPVITLGEFLVESKHQFSTSWPDQMIKEHCEWTFNLLGEPAMPVWTREPGILDVTHPTILPIGPSPFDVHVEDINWQDINKAYVCLWKGNEVYLTGYTNSAGDITFYPSPTSAGSMYVTVTKHDRNSNYIPYEGHAYVSQQGYTSTIKEDSGISGVPVQTMLSILYPNPFRQNINIRYQLSESSRVDIMIYDASGRLVRNLQADFRNPGYYTMTWDGKDNTGRMIPTGIYFVRFRAGDYDQIERTIFIR